MTYTLRDACDLAEAVRYAEDIPATAICGAASTEKDRIKRYFTTSSLRISPQLTPELSIILTNTCNFLRLPKENVHAWVYPSAEIQAYCVGNDAQECFIRVSSGVVQLLNAKELAFVIGHEVGHFLLRHNSDSDIFSGSSLEDTMRSKSAEISADRLGLLACGDLEPAICAMLKTLSGLGGDHINLDIPAFLNELRSVSEIRTLDAEIWNTHPPLPLRVKALLWFSMGKTFASYTDGDVAGKMEKNALDQKVFNDMKSQLGDFTQQQFDQAEEEVQLWLSAVAVCRDGRLDKSEQQKLNTDLGLEATQKLISFLSMHSAEEIDAVLLEKLNSACENYQHLAPTRSRQVIPELINEVSSRFQQSDLRQFIRDKSHLLSEISVNIISSG